MAEQDGPRGDARDVAREQRLQALGELARQRAQSPSPTSATSAPATPATAHGRRLMAILAAMVLLIAIGAGALAYLRPHPSTAQRPTVPSQIVLDFEAQHLGCAQDAAWSPDGARLAVLGYTDACPMPYAALGYSYAAGLIEIYPSQTGKTPLRLSPDDLINAVLHLPQAQVVSITNGAVINSTSKTAIQYSRLLWSRDGQRLALPFLVEVISNAHATADGDATWDDTRVTGVLLMDTDGSHPRVVSHTLGNDEPSSGRWDLSTGTYTSGSSLTSGPYGNLPPALAYAWDASGHLQPQTPLTGTTPPPAPPLAPIGDPTGDAAFTIWQPAAIGPVTLEYSPNGSISTLSATYEYRATLTAWSPDDSYLLTSLPIGIYLRDPNQPGPTADQLALAKQRHVDGPWLPVRDQALSAVLAANPPDSLNHLSVSTTSFAWSPDGKRLAAIRILPDDSGSHVILPGKYLVDIYDCASGQRLASLTPALRIASSSYSMGGPLLRWSRDGSRLLIYDTVLDEATIWGPGKLPAK